jgi:hypothetical protein
MRFDSTAGQADTKGESVNKIMCSPFDTSANRCIDALAPTIKLT